MKKLFLYLFALALIASCKDKKADEPKTDTPAATETTQPAATGNDATLTQWLSGKMLVSTSKDPATDMWNNLKLNADGTCTDKDDASAKWSVKDGKFNFEAAMTLTKDMIKKDDTTLVFKGVIGDAAYILKPIK
ncbi:MAG: hypothetical protein IPH18_13700 [Chitinophagaceae bacterium]|nr:hypothetical protein [Chitinophagaceae bacterium]MBK8952336.1 hypothetical protein [Chitinophagaceae bacterium]